MINKNSITPTLGLGNGAGMGVVFDAGVVFFSTLGEEREPRMALPPPPAVRDFFFRFCFSSSSSISFSQSTCEWNRTEVRNRLMRVFADLLGLQWPLDDNIN